MNAKILLFLIMFILLFSVVSALDCQYTINETYTEDITKQFIDEVEVDVSEPFTSIENIKVWKEWLGYTMDYQFNVKNNLDYPLDLTVSWIVGGKLKSQQISLDPLGYKLIKGQYQQDLGGLSQDTIKVELNNYEERIETVLNERTVCVLCDGITCLNDDIQCKENSQCGSGICNMAGFCGHEEEIICNEWLPGTENCNNQCLTPLSKAIGEPYSCDWECSSKTGEEGICQRSPPSKYLFIGILILLFGVGAYFIIKSAYKKGWDKQTTEIIDGATKTGNDIIDEAKKEAKMLIVKAQTRLEKLNDTLEVKQFKINEITKELKHLKNETEEKKKLQQELMILNEDTDKLKEEQIVKRTEYEKELKNYTETRLKHYLNKQNYKVYLNENGYEVFARTGSLFHRWWYKQHNKGKIPKGHEIHHIDGDKLNNKLENLEALSVEDHRRKHRNKHKK